MDQEGYLLMYLLCENNIITSKEIAVLVLLAQRVLTAAHISTNHH